VADVQSRCDTSEEVRTTRWRRALEPAGTPAGHDTPRRRRRRDGGFSIVEIVITITLMGVVVVPILAAVVAGIRASSVSLAAAEVETVLVNAVDRVNRAPRTVGQTFPCDLTAPVLASVEVHGWPTSSTTVGHEYLDDDGVWQSDASGTACPGGVFKNGLVQRITVTVTSPEHDVSRSLQVVRGGGEIDI
jgi:type II secretory pathway pseudopilin PulG